MAKKIIRKSGILLHITSLPSKEGIGTLGSQAFLFCDWLKNAGQKLWQILPLGPTGYGDSPYASFSTFAGNPLMIDFADLVKRGWAKKADVKVPQNIKSSERVDFGALVWWKLPLLYKCASYFLLSMNADDKKAFTSFKKKNAFWLDDFALFTSIKKYYDSRAAEEKVYGEASRWNNYWPKDLARHQEKALNEWTQLHKDELEQIKVVQFFFFSQWQALKDYANAAGIKIIGDIPIFVAGDSADLWANQKFFQICRKRLQQKSQAGVPPDYFSATGQLWGNPLYDWKALKEDGYSWWVNRISSMMKLVDIVRIDHFRGFESYWKVPEGEKTAVNGKWTKGPGKDLFDVIKAKCPKAEIIAEDLGVITKKVADLRDQCAFPGMKILQFAFNENPWTEESSRNLYLPENFDTENCVVYTGTHDNNTTTAALKENPLQYKWNVCDYLGLKDDTPEEKICQALVECAESSCAKYCIIPLQDILKTGSEGRMNVPSAANGNWSWRLSSLPSASEAKKLLNITVKAGR
ncbi:4-alpha-glucanotransferase [Treponema sp.]|uniref:4-alpha-glucanotransferase n=1 Tax=Treponema sp. TaxID=166 RepID=UPI0025E16E43|nr:4-alpha-glucanotransferase [Treponema sp.]MCR5218234.1 4-alpha-glucanotransferase [Treponema sp.]